MALALEPNDGLGLALALWNLLAINKWLNINEVKMRSYKIKSGQDGTGYLWQRNYTIKTKFNHTEKRRAQFVLFSPSAGKCILSWSTLLQFM